MSEIILALSYRQDIVTDLLSMAEEKFTRDANNIQSIITTKDGITNADVGRVFAYITYSPEVILEGDVLSWTAKIFSTNLYVLKSGGPYFPFSTRQAFAVVGRKQG
jgi:hypothetical protein